MGAHRPRLAPERVPQWWPKFALRTPPRVDVLERAADDGRQVNQPVGVTPLVVVPADDLEEVAAQTDGQWRVEGAGCRRTDDVRRDDGIGRVHQLAHQWTGLRGSLERGVDLVDGGRLV